MLNGRIAIFNKRGYMFRKVLIIPVALLFVLVGCNPKLDMLTICQTQSYTAKLVDAEVTRRDTLYIYYDDERYVTKTVLIEENILTNGDIEDLNSYAKSVDEMFKTEVFQLKGYEYTSELSDKTFTWKTSYDYSEVDIKVELEKGKIFLDIQEFIDENYKIPYDKVIEAYTKSGYSIEESNIDSPT